MFCRIPTVHVGCKSLGVSQVVGSRHRARSSLCGEDRALACKDGSSREAMKKSLQRLVMNTLLIMLVGAGIVRAQPTLPPGYSIGQAGIRPDRSPLQSAGLIVWSHGSIPQGRRVTDAAPPEWLKLLAQSGWDYVQLFRDPVDDTREALQATNAVLDWAKSRGYPKLVVGGQSRGGWLSILAAGARSDIWGLVATAPGIHGTYSSAAVDQTLKDMKEALVRNRTPRVGIFYFAGDDAEALEGGRGQPTSDALSLFADRAYLVVDRPRGLSGHGAAYTGAFARLYGECIGKLLSDAPAIGQLRCDMRGGLAGGSDLRLPFAPVFAQDTAAPVSGPAAMIGHWYGVNSNGTARFIAIPSIDGDSTWVLFARAELPTKDNPEREWVKSIMSLQNDELIVEESAGRRSIRSVSINQIRMMFKEPRGKTYSLDLFRFGSWPADP